MIRFRSFRIGPTFTPLGVAAFFSLFLSIGTECDITIWQRTDDDFGSQGLQTIGATHAHFVDRMWAVPLCFAILPVVWMIFAIRRRRRWRARAAVCFRCGYNLTGNTSGVCPECGKKVPDKSEVVT